MEYIRSKKKTNEECIFCEKVKDKSNDRENLLLFRSENAFVAMNLYPYNNGHLLISPNDHIDSPTALGGEVLREIMILANHSMSIIKKLMNAEGFNFGANIGKAGGAGIADHLHFHVVPRWQGDTNFMPVLGQSKVVIDSLLNTYDQLSSEFKKVS